MSVRASRAIESCQAVREAPLRRLLRDTPQLAHAARGGCRSCLAAEVQRVAVQFRPNVLSPLSARRVLTLWIQFGEVLIRAREKLFFAPWAANPDLLATDVDLLRCSHRPEHFTADRADVLLFG